MAHFGSKTLVFGATGSGKTTALSTFKAMGLKVFAVFTENGMKALEHTDQEWVEWQYIAPALPNLDAMINMARQINVLDRKQLANYNDPFRSKHQQFVNVLSALANLKSDRTGKTYGKADALGDDWVLALDSLSGTSIMSMELVGGDKPIFDQGEWGMAMQRIEKMIQLLCFSLPCHVVVNAHEARETDEISQSTKIMVDVPGKKLAPKVPRFFDNVFYSFRKDRQWLWSTNYPQVADLKSRHLGIFDAMPQDFKSIIEVDRKLKQEGK